MDSRHDLQLMSEAEKIEYWTGKSEKKFTFLRGVCSDGEHQNLSYALGYAREKHKAQTRKSGEPYIIHPLSLACDAVGMNMRDDPMLAAAVLHDVPEDIGDPIMELPIDDETRMVVEYLTLRKLSGESKLESKKRYYANLSKNKYATILKGLDRRNNLGSMAKAMSRASIVKNCFETWFFIIPLLKDAKLNWPEYSNQLHTIRTDLTALTDTLSVLVGIDLSYKNPPGDDLMGAILEAKNDEDLKKIPEIFNSEKRFPDLF